MHWELLDRYLSESCDSEERNEVDTWLAQSAERRHVLEKIAEALKHTPPETLRMVRSRLEEEIGLERGSRDASYKHGSTAKKRIKKPPAAVKAPGEGRAKPASVSTKPPRGSAKPRKAAKKPSKPKPRKGVRRGKKGGASR